MDKLFFRLFLVSILSIWTFCFSFPWNAYNIDVPFSWNEYKLWLDLQWWVELDYKVDLTEVQKEKDYNITKENSILEWLKSIIDKRVEALNINDSVITTANYWWEKHIVVQIPLKWTSKQENELNIKRAKEAIWRVMKIEFKEMRTSVSQKDLDQRKQIAVDLLKESKESKYDFSVTQAKYKDTYENVEIWSMTWSFSDLSKYFKIDLKDLKNWFYDKILSWTWINNTQLQSENGYYVLNIKKFDQYVLDFDYAFVWAKPSEWIPASDSKWRILNDKYFLNSAVSFNQAFQPMIELNFNNEWAEIFAELTKRLRWKQIAIFVWWEMLTSPNVNEPILNWKAVITWSYSSDEAKKLSQDINTWVVPAPIYLTSERTIDSRLWFDSLHQLVFAWIYGFLVIFLFLIFTYRISWFFAGVSLFIYVFLTLSVVKWLWIVLTLASIAGLILSVWMAIDANILIFERIKDELNKWANLEQAVKNWFDRSWSAIWDSNLTWLIIAVILFIFWVNMIKWFWLMLWIWIVVSLFTAMYVSRLFILIVMKKKDLKLSYFLWNLK